MVTPRPPTCLARTRACMRCAALAVADRWRLRLLSRDARTVPPCEGDEHELCVAGKESLMHSCCAAVV